MSAENPTRLQKALRKKGHESISRDSLQDKTLSFKARGIMAYLKSMPDQWVVHGVQGLAEASDKDGYSAVNAGLKELESAGLLIRLKRRGESGAWEWLWVHGDDPDEVSAGAAEWTTSARGCTAVRGGNPRPRRRGRVLVSEDDLVARP